MNTSVLAFACLDHLCFPGPLSLDSKRLTTPPRKWVFSNRSKKTNNPNPSPAGKTWFGLFCFGAEDGT